MIDKFGIFRKLRCLQSELSHDIFIYAVNVGAVLYHIDLCTIGTIRDIHGHLCCDLSGLIHGHYITTQQSFTDPALHHAVHRHLGISDEHTDRLRTGILLATAII